VSALSSQTAHRVVIPTLLNVRCGQKLQCVHEILRIQRTPGAQSPAERLAGEGSSDALLREVYVGTATGSLPTRIRYQPARLDNDPEQVTLVDTFPAPDTRPDRTARRSRNPTSRHATRLGDVRQGTSPPWRPVASLAGGVKYPGSRLARGARCQPMEPTPVPVPNLARFWWNCPLTTGQFDGNGALGA